MNIKCPNPACGLSLTCEDQLAGREVQCPNCNQVFRAEAPAEDVATVTGATIISGPAPPSPSAASPPPPPPADPKKQRREALVQVIQGLVVAVGCVLLQYLVDLLPGMDVSLGRGTLSLWLKAVIALVLLVIMLRLLRPLRIVIDYYIGLIFRVSAVLATEKQLQSEVSSVGLCLALILYLGFIYQSVLPPVLGSIAVLVGLSANVVKLIRLAFAIVGIGLAIKLILAARPLVSRLTASLAERAVAATERVDSKPCPSCGVRVDLTAKFCPACGKAIPVGKDARVAAP